MSVFSTDPVCDSASSFEDKTLWNSTQGHEDAKSGNASQCQNRILWMTIRLVRESMSIASDSVFATSRLCDFALNSKGCEERSDEEDGAADPGGAASVSGAARRQTAGTLVPASPRRSKQRLGSTAQSAMWVALPCKDIVLGSTQCDWSEAARCRTRHRHFRDSQWKCLAASVFGAKLRPVRLDRFPVSHRW